MAYSFPSRKILNWTTVATRMNREQNDGHRIGLAVLELTDAVANMRTITTSVERIRTSTGITKIGMNTCRLLMMLMTEMNRKVGRSSAR